MTFWEQWVQRPQSLGVRKALFQVHLWVGIGVGLYIFLISVSGSVIVYRDELARAFTHPAVIVVQTSHRLTAEDLTQSAQRLYPGYRVTDVLERRRPDRAAGNLPCGAAEQLLTGYSIPIRARTWATL